MTDAPDPLSEQDLAEARAELAEGRPFPVWFTAAAVGVPVGGSAKIVSIAEVAEGDFIEVRPTGTRDTVFCSPGELTRTRPPRRRAKQAPPPEPPAPRPGRQQAAPARRESPKQDTAKSAAQGDLPERSGTAPAAVPERKPGRARSGPARPAEVTVTLSSSADGEWTVEVS